MAIIEEGGCYDDETVGVSESESASQWLRNERRRVGVTRRRECSVADEVAKKNVE